MSRRVSPPATAAPAETDRFSPSFERRRGMKPLSQPTTLVDVFRVQGVVSLTRYFLSPSLSLFISLSRCLFDSLFVFFLSFLLSAFLLVRKNGREGDTGVQSPGQISSTARAFASVSGDVFAKTLCSRFSKVRCNYSSGSERRSRARESKGKKEEETRPTRRRARGRGRLELCRGLLYTKQTYEEVF